MIQRLQRPWRITRQLAEVLVGLYILFLGFIVPSTIALNFNFEKLGLLIGLYLLCVAGVAFYLGIKNSKSAILLVLLIMPWQPLLTMPFSNFLDTSGVQGLIATKEVYIGILLAALYIRNRKKIKWNNIDMVVGLFLFLYCIFAMISPAGVFGIAVSFRQGFMIAAFYFVGRLSLFDLKDIRWLLIISVNIALAIAVFGFIERFGFTASTWQKIGALDYLDIKKTSVDLMLKIDLPLNWSTRIGNVIYRRMVSSIADPTSLSRYLSFPVLILVFFPRLFRRSMRLFPFRFTVISIALLLTLGRGGLLIVLGGIAIRAFYKQYLAGFLVIITIAILIFTLPVFDLQAASVARHIEKAQNGINQLISYPIGKGLGTGGGLAVYYGDIDEKETTESYLVALSYQIGILGVLSYLLFVIAVSGRMLKIYSTASKEEGKNSDVAKMALLGLSVIVGIFSTSLLSNSAVSPISAGSSLLYVGTLIGLYDRWFNKPNKPDGQVSLAP